MSEFTAIQTRNNSHRLFASGTACNPTKLPKGDLFVEGEEVEVEALTYDENYQVNGTKLVTVRKQVLCNKCNKVDHTGRR